MRVRLFASNWSRAPTAPRPSTFGSSKDVAGNRSLQLNRRPPWAALRKRFMARERSSDFLSQTETASSCDPSGADGSKPLGS